MLTNSVLAEYLPDLEQVAEAASAGLATDLRFGRLRKHCRQYVKATGAIFTVRVIIMADKRNRPVKGRSGRDCGGITVGQIGRSSGQEHQVVAGYMAD